MMSLIKKLPFYRAYTTKQNERWWKDRKIDWDKDYLKTWNHPHRYIISGILKQYNWLSLVEVGCGSGPNLVNIIKNIKGRQVGGVDINEEAIALAQKTFTNGYFKVGSAEDILMSDKSVDVVLTDMLLIYVGPRKIKKHLQELKRIGRNIVMLHEYHEKSWWRRWKLRIFSGRHAYDYEKLLNNLGFYDIIKYKMPEFEKDSENRFRYIFVARIPKR